MKNCLLGIILSKIVMLITSVKYPARARLWKIEHHRSLVRTSVNKHCAHVLLFVPCDLLIWASAGNQLMEWLPYLVVTASICHINWSGTSIAKHAQICSNINHFSCISHWVQKCFHFRTQINCIVVFLQISIVLIVSNKDNKHAQV